MTPPLRTYRRDWTLPRGWTGLRRDDADILQVHRDQLRLPDQYDLYTGVCVGHCHVCPPHSIVNQEILERYMYSRQIDCILLPKSNEVPRPFLICEIKPAAAYVALGQVLAMRYLFEQTYPSLQPTLPLVMTDACDPELRPLFEAHNVTVWCHPAASYTPTGTST